MLALVWVVLMRLWLWLGGILTALGAGVALVSAMLAVGFLENPFPGFALYPNQRVALSVGFEDDPARPRPFDRLLSVRGAPLEEGARLQDALRENSLGTLVDYEVQEVEEPFSFAARRGARYEAVLALRPFRAVEFISSFGVLFLLGLSFFAIGAVAFFTKPSPKSLSVLLFCLNAGLILVCTFDTFSTQVFATNLYELACWMMPASIIGLSLAFPRESRVLQGRNWPLWVSYLAAPLPMLAGLRFFSEGERWFQIHFANVIAIDIASLYLFGRLLWQQRRQETPLVRQRSRVLLLGLLAGFVPPSLVVLLALGFNVDPPAGYFSAVGLLLIPATLAYAIFRHDLLDVDVVVRRGLFYVSLLGVAGGLYFVLLSVFSLLAAQTPVSRSPLFPLFFAGLVVLLTEPVRRALWRYADRIYFRQGYDYRLTLRAASDAMARVRDPDHVVAKLSASIEEALEPERVVIELYEAPPDDPLCAFCREAEEVVHALGLSEEEPAAKDPRGLALASLVARGARLAVPLLSEGRLLGLLLLGQKKSGLLYTAEDLSLLRTLANQSAVALENARRFRLIEEMNASLEQKVVERTRALDEARAWLVQSEKMAALGRLVAGVAHELNNPSNAIGHAAEAMGEAGEQALQFAEFVAARPSLSEDDRAAILAEHKRRKFHRVPEDISVMRDVLQSASRRISSVVSDLRNFSRGRIDEAREADLSEEVERALRMLRPRLAEVELVRNFDPRSSLRCFPDALGQVILNLLANAVDAIHEKGRIEIATLRGPSSLELSIRDSGPGIPAESLPRLFEPFFTTKDPGQGTGLGLWISYQIVARHQGNLSAENVPGGGARFRVILPLEPSAPA